MKNTKQVPKVVVVGGGFAGIAVLKELTRIQSIDVTLVSKSEMFEYYPGLYKLVTGALPIEVTVPLEAIFPERTVKFIKTTFSGLDQSRQVIAITGDPVLSEIPYDYVVLALGSETNFFNIKGLPELSYSFKSVKEALRLKQHFCEIFSRVKVLTKEEMVSMLHIVIVGAGPSGVELAGDLRHYLERVAKQFTVDPGLITIDLIEAGPRVLPALSVKVSQKAEARLRKMGVNIFVNRTIESQEIEEVVLKDMQMNSHTVIWTAGTRLNKAFMNIPNITFDEHERIIVSNTLSLPNDNHIFIAGDGAGTPYSGLAQTAIHHGTYLGKHIRTILEGKQVIPYKPHRPSFVIPIGNYWAIFNHGDFVMTGILPWLLRTAIDIRYFLSILSLRHVISMFRKGKKYRHVHGGCTIDRVEK